MFAADDVLVASDCDEDVAFFSGVSHRKYAEAIHHGFDSLHRIDFGDDDVSAMALGAHCNATSAPAVAGDNDLESGEEKIGGANDAVERGLASAVAVVEEMLGLRVVDGDDRIFQCAVFRHGAKADDAGGGFFGAGDDVFYLFGALSEEHGDEVGAVVHSHLRLVIESGAKVAVISFVVFALDRIGRNVEVAIEGGCDLVLRGERVGSAENDVGAAIAKSDHEVRGFASDVKARGNTETLERLVLDETLTDGLQHRHLLLRPFDFAFAGVGQRNILYIALLEFCCRHNVLLDRMYRNLRKNFCVAARCENFL